MKFAKALSLAIVALAFLGTATTARATFYDYGNYPLSTGGSFVAACPPQVSSCPPASPGQGVLVGDHITGKVTDISTNGITAATTEWYFTTSTALSMIVNLASSFGGSTYLDITGPGGYDSGHINAACFNCYVNLGATGNYVIDLFTPANIGYDPAITAPPSVTWDLYFVPLPAAAWLMLSGLAGLGAMARRRREAPATA